MKAHLESIWEQTIVERNVEKQLMKMRLKDYQ
jgi:hypothetical protein